MKKFLSLAMVVAMVLVSFAALIPAATASAAPSSEGEVILYEENFDNLGSKTNEALFNALGWKSGWSNTYTTVTGGGTKDGLSLVTGVSGKALQIKGDQILSGGYETYYVLLEDESIANGIKVSYDFKYDSSAKAPASGDFTRGLNWHGNGTLTREDSWNMLLRMDKTILNHYRKSSGNWGSAISEAYKWSNGSATDTWYTVEFVVDPTVGVSVSVKPQGASSWAYTHSWSNATYEAYPTETSSCFEDFLGIQVQPGVTVMIDNLKVSYDEVFPQFIAYQPQSGAGDTFSLRLISVIENLDCESVGFKVKMSLRKDNVVQSAEQSVTCRYAYETFDGKKANELEGAISTAQYLYALSIEGIPSTWEIEYTVTPFMVVDGETVFGRTRIITYAHNDWKSEVPAYDTNSGNVENEVEVSDGIWRKLITGTTRAEYDSYRNTLVENGYELYAENTINQNHYATYKNNASMVHVYYEAEKNRARLIYAPIGVMVDYNTAPVLDERVTDPSLIFMSLDYTTSAQVAGNNGMGFIYTMSDGSYMIIDGGYGADTDTLYQYLKNNNKRTDGKILIRAWVITHYHEDHYGNFETFANRYADQVTLENFVANFDASANALERANLVRVQTALAKFTAKQNTKFVVPQVGQKMYFGEAQMEFLLTQEMLYPDATSINGNNLSLVAKILFQGETLLMTGDAYPDQTKIEAAYGSYLKSDYVQTPHHGYEATSDSFYDKVDANFAFVTTSDAECESRIERGAATSGADAANFGGLHHLIVELETPYEAASGDYYIISYARSYLNVGDYETQKDTVLYEDYFS